jgi:hypothetical protein
LARNSEFVMKFVLVVLIITIAASLVIINIYFRSKIFREYKFLLKNKVHFSLRDALSRHKIELNVLPKYPDFQKQLLSFSNKLRLSVGILGFLFVSLTMIALILISAT